MSVWFPRKNPVANDDGWDISANRGVPYCVSSWWKQRKSRCGLIPSGVTSFSIWPCDEDARSPRSPWHADSRFVCTGCGARDGSISSSLSSVRTRASPEQALVCSKTPCYRLGSPLPFTGEFELAIMIERWIEEMHESG